ncbi:MAG TPA: gluconate 2-dehydrogenase subunit 3 family protein [Candidatus Bathyarchaeia archaeon]|nr:gluconate 2-dehydrogenase subunit 3 family protein [Candidatus Bathyarchaeia archaeon]
MPRSFPRRTFLQFMAAGGAAVSIPWVDQDASGFVVIRSPRGRQMAPAHFFTFGQRQVIAEMAAAIVPEDQTVGATGTNVVEYIDRYLAAFDSDPPTIYRGGPFSGRTPFPDPRTGQPSGRFPSDDFLNVIPPTRMQELAFRVLLDGSDSVPNGNINAPLVPPTPGLRSIYKTGIDTLNAAAQAAGKPFTALTDDEKLAAFKTTSSDFQNALLTNIAEGMFCPPEYGGNQNMRAWRDYFYDGDSQPLGHTLFNPQTGELTDRPDQPNQTIDPNQPNNGLEPSVETFVESIVLAQGGKRFF